MVYHGLHVTGITFLKGAFFTTLKARLMLLTDGAIETVLVFEMGRTLDPHLEAAALIDSAAGREALSSLYGPYLDIGRRAGLPMQIGTPTFRCSPDRVAAAGRPASDLQRLNRACVEFHRALRGDQQVVVAGVLGPRGDAYLPGEAPPAEVARDYHRAQAAALAQAGADRLYAPTFAALGECIGVAQAMAETGLPYAIGFVLGQDGHLLDGVSLDHAIESIDSACSTPPSHYMLSCVHPDLARRALSNTRSRRVTGIKANTSRKSTAELVQLGHLETEEPARFAREMVELARDFQLTVLGGCCGTNASHIQALADHMGSSGSNMFGNRSDMAT